jgi:hypothetical protein
MTFMGTTWNQQEEKQKVIINYCNKHTLPYTWVVTLYIEGRNAGFQNDKFFTNTEVLNDNLKPNSV